MVCYECSKAGRNREAVGLCHKLFGWTLQPSAPGTLLEARLRKG